MPDLIDLLLVGGVALLAVGLWLMSPALSLTVTGALLIVIWLVAFLRAARRQR